MDEKIEVKAEAIESLFEIKISTDKMMALLSCTPEFAASPDAVEMITSRLRQMRIAVKPESSMLAAALDKAKEAGEGLHDLLLCQGQEPEPSVDGKMEWTGDYFKEGYCIDPETNLINFHQKAGDPSVEKDRLLVVVTRGKAGKNGSDVYGRAILVPRPVEVSLRSGRNVRWDGEASGFRAMCTGRVRLRGSTLDVDPVLFIKNGVGSESGDIKHNGRVVIDGDVEMDFRVEATEGIEIRGLAYASDIVCGGNLAVEGGINGNPFKSIIVKGDILAKYIMNASIRSEGNVLSNNEILHCQIKTRGQAGCHKGRIIGGEIMAAAGITAGEAGSEDSIPTLLTVGVDFKLQARQASLNGEINRLKKAMAKLAAGRRNLEANRRHLNNEQKEKVAEIKDKLLEGEEEIGRLEQEKSTISGQMIKNGNAVIKIAKVVHPGVVFRICDCQFVVRHTLVGPILVRLNKIKGRLELSDDTGEEEGAKN